MSELSFICILWLELIGGLLRALHYYALSVRKITDQILEPEEFKCHFIVRYTIVARYNGFTFVVCPSVFSFPDDYLSKHQWIFFTKLGMCIDILKIWFGIVNGQISSIFDRPVTQYFRFTLIFTYITCLHFLSLTN